jgi:CelD/BcsL family acetyltransferase involved in cellulose biosynthesis
MALQLSANLAFAAEPGRFSHEIVTTRTVAELATLRGMWTELANYSDDGSLCDGYDYCELAASKAYARQQPVEVVLVREEGELIAVWPFAIERRGPLRLARRLTSGIREEYGRPLVRRGAGAGSWSAIVAALRHVNADALEVHWVHDGSPLLAALDSVPQTRLLRLLPERTRGYPGFAVTLRGAPTFEAFETSALSSTFRQSLRKYRRRLERQGKVEFGWCETPEETATLVSWIFEQKRAWATARGIRNDSLNDDRVITFFSELATRLDLTKYPIVAFTKVDGRPVAASLNTVGSQTLEGGITTYDPAFGEFSVGSLHLYDLLRWAHARGLDYDFRPVHVDYKERWATRHTWHETRLVVLTLRGRLFEFTHLRAFAARLKGKMKREIQRRLRKPAK